MFPYYGKLESITNKEHYSRNEISQINLLAAQHQLEVIPLIQTFGHMEFVLKGAAFASLREVPKYPQVLCPSANESIILVQLMIDQVLSLHPQVNSLHIGSDEVYYLGVCPRCIQRMSELPERKKEHPKVDLFIKHVKAVAEHVLIKHGKRVLMWDDEFRGLDVSIIQQSGLGSLVHIVVWNYGSDVDRELDASLWNKYSRSFSSIWIATAFKGANRPDSMTAEETRYLANHAAWTRAVKTSASGISIQGIILTGWQRYDHFSVLCEILPVAIPSLLASLTYLNHPYQLPVSTILESTSEKLGCESILNRCSYPGASATYHVLRLREIKMEFAGLRNESAFRGWAHPLNRNTNFSNIPLIENVLSHLERIYSELNSLQKSIEADLIELFPKSSVSEWMLTHFYPTLDQVKEISSSLLPILNTNVFPRRPLQMQLAA